MTRSILIFSVFLFAAVFAVGTAYGQDSGTNIGGYGEIHYNEPEGSGKGVLDFHRFVLYVNHQFDDWVSFTSELEVEHTFVGPEENSGELSLEQAFIELRPSDAIGVRAGILLVPVSLINAYHEPPTFHGVERPNYHRNLIPTTWREAGVGIFGSPVHDLNYQVYVMSSLTAEGLSGSSGLRGARQKGILSSTADIAVTGRIEYLPLLGLSVGGSFFTGATTGGNASLGDGTVTLLSGDVRYGIGNLALRGEAAMISIADADKLNAAFDKGVADNLNGWYIEAAYNILPHLTAETEQQMYLFGRYERYNTQAKVTGFTANDAYDRTEITAGITYKPVPDVAFKIDYQLFDDARDADAKGQFNAGVGYAFF
ncbi:MAG: hypothetical protein IH600_07930 [Bacteroidetes bacterium]|nr:hypothetical protein [Bacteroidota bacterium]